MIYGYAKVLMAVSEFDRTSLENLKYELKSAGALDIYIDIVTGVKDDCPELIRVSNKLHAGDVFVVPKLDHVAGSVVQGAKFVENLLNNGVVVHILDMGIMDDSTEGEIVKRAFFAFVRFYQNITSAAIQNAKAQAKLQPGFKEGRPKKYTADELDQAMELLLSHTYPEVESMTGISKSTLIRHKKTLKKGGS